MKREIAIIGAPIDMGSSELGVSKGPEAFRDVSAERILRDSGFKVEDKGDIGPVDGSKNNIQSVYKYSEEIKSLAQATLSNRIPLVIGGDHSVAIGSISASLAKYPDLNVLWIDAHPDINTPQTSPSGNVHGMVTSTLMGLGDEKLASLVENKLKAQNLYFLGIKDADCAELELIKKHKIYSLSIQDILLRGFGNALGGLFNSLRGKKVHVSLDLDSIDILDAPGVGIPSRGGFYYREIKYIAEEISKLDVVSMDIVELNPDTDEDRKTAKMALELAITCLGGEYSMYTEYLKNQEK